MATTQLPLLNFAHSPAAEKRKIVPVERKRMQKKDDVVQQALYLAAAIPEFLLSEEDIRMNGFIRTPKGAFPELPPLECLKTKEFLTARGNLLAGCHYIKRKHGKELEEMCAKFDISDEQLCSNFRTLMNTVWEEPLNWGRLVSLFVVTNVLLERLYREGHQRKMESVLSWFGTFLRDHAVPWIRERGGWGGLLYGGNVDIPREDCKTAVTEHAATAGLVTLAALGVGVLVGAIIGR